MTQVRTDRQNLTSITALIAASLVVASGCGQSAASSSASGQSTLRVLGTVSVPVDGQPLVSGFGEAWSASSNGLIKLSVPSAQASTVVHEPIDDVAVSTSHVYALSRQAGTVYEVDPSTAQVTRRWKLGSSVESLTTTDDELYVAHSGEPAGVDRIDLGTSSVNPRIGAWPERAGGESGDCGGARNAVAHARVTSFPVRPCNDGLARVDSDSARRWR